MNKKALSPVIAKILLILLTIAILIIIILWLMGFFSEGILKFKEPIENQCGDIRFKFSITKAEALGFPEIQIANNGLISIFDFYIKYIKENGESEGVYLGKSLDPGSSLSLEIIKSTTDTKEIRVSPVLLGTSKNKNKQYICLDNVQSILLKQVDK